MMITYVQRINNMIRKIAGRLKLDPSESAFLKTADAFLRANNSSRTCRDDDARRVLLQISADYYYAALFLSAKINLSRDKPVRFFGLWHYNIVLSPSAESIQLFRRWGRAFFNLIDRYKWTRVHNLPEFEVTFPSTSRPWRTPK